MFKKTNSFYLLDLLTFRFSDVFHERLVGNGNDAATTESDFFQQIVKFLVLIDGVGEEARVDSNLARGAVGGWPGERLRAVASQLEQLRDEVFNGGGQEDTGGSGDTGVRGDLEVGKFVEIESLLCGKKYLGKGVYGGTGAQSSGRAAHRKSQFTIEQTEAF